VHAHIDDQPFPRGPLIAAGVLIAFSILLAATARLTGIGAERLQLAAPVSAVTLRFADLPDGSVGVTDATGDRKIAKLAPGEAGFVRVVMRGFAYKRSRQGTGPEQPFELSRRADGSLVIEDPTTGHLVLLNGFGHLNAAAFQDLLDKGKNLP
jgi:putative photosynthetic complex assembly protein